MRLDRANRSFLAFIGIALLSGAIVLCGAVGAVLLPLILAPHSRWGVSSVPAIMFIAPIAAGLGLGSRSLGRQVLASRRLARRVRRLAVATPDDLKRSATHAGLAGRIVLLTLAGNGGSFAPPFVAVCSAIKFTLISISILYAVCGLVLWLRARGLQPSRAA
jgi:hypothetical protein